MNATFQGQFRPLVKQAWARHCREQNVRPDDASLYDRWYRSTLHATAGITSTRQAKPADANRLIETFRMLADPAATAPTPPRMPTFTDHQQRAFDRLVLRAWRKVQATDPSVRFADWIAARLRDLGSSGSRHKDRFFDRVMGLFAVIADDEYWLDHTARADEIRIQYVIRQKLAELSEIRHTALDWSYVQGIHAQARLAPTLEDCPAETLLVILEILGSTIARER